jgi:hypothetical protein
MGKRPQKKMKQMAASTTYKLVGEFVNHWNLLESTINNAIVKLSKLDEVHGVIITANLNFQTKMNILTTLIDLLGQSKPEHWKETARKTISTIRTFYGWRNLVVHYVIEPIDNKQVKFLKVSAKGKLNFPDTTRTKQQFRDGFAELVSAWQTINKIADELSTKKTSDLAKALASLSPSPPAGPFAPPGYPPAQWLTPFGPPSSTYFAGGGRIVGAGPFGPLATAPPKAVDDDSD